MMVIFFATGAWKALYDKDDHLHESAVQTSSRIKEQRLALITSDFICDETITLLRMKTSHELAIRFGKALWKSQIIKIVHVETKLQKRAWEIFKKYNDKAFSFTDCTSFAIMQELDLSHAFAFDSHFRQFGIQTLPSSDSLQKEISRK